MKKKLDINKELGHKVKEIIKVKKYQVFGFVEGLILTISLLVLSYCLRDIIDCISSGESIKTKSVIIILIAFLFYFLSYFLGPIVYQHLYANARKRLNVYLLGNTLNQNQDFFRKYEQGYIQAIIEDLSYDVSSHYASFIIKLISDLVIVLGYFGIIFYYSWQLASITFTILIIVMILTNRIVNKQALAAKDFKVKMSKVKTHLLETISNVNLIKMVDKTKYYTDTYKDDYTENFYNPLLKYRILEAMYTTLYAVILFMMPLLILILGLVLKDVFMISLGSTISVYSLLGNLQEPIRDLSALAAEIRQNKENLGLMKDFISFDKNDKLQKIDDFVSLEFKSKGIQFENNEILKDLSFTVLKDDFVLIRGSSGSGKSTIFKHIIKDASSDAIEILLNGKNIQEYNIFPDILMIQQKSSLFTTTIIDNIKCGYEATKEELEEVYNICMLNSFIDKYGENKAIDNISSNISGGEIQRICIARILLRKPRLLLMDEITSALDPDTTASLAKNIYDFAKKYHITVIAISHKNEFDEYANKAVDVGKNGSIEKE